MKLVNYFGYGANAHPRMMEAIIGRLPKGEPATLFGYSLAVQTLKDIPDTVPPAAPIPRSPRAIIRNAWGEQYKAYVLVRDPEGHVRGTLWHITEPEHRLVENWQLVEQGWSSTVYAEVQSEDGTRTLAVTEWSNGQSVTDLADGDRYPLYILPEEDLIRVATIARNDLLERMLPFGQEHRHLQENMRHYMEG